MISSEGNNMANIRATEKKSYGVTPSIINKLESLNFESAIILHYHNAEGEQSICRSMTKITEAQLRRIKRIEENYLRRVFKTNRSYQIVLY